MLHVLHNSSTVNKALKRFIVDQKMFEKFKKLLLWFSFQQKLEWWVKFRNPKDILEKHPTFLVGEVYMIINSLLCLCHGKFYYAVCCSNYVDVSINKSGNALVC